MFGILSVEMFRLVKNFEKDYCCDFFDRYSEVIANGLNQFFKEISMRDDLITFYKIKEFFRIDDLKYCSMLPPKYLLKFSSNLASDEIAIQDFDFDFKRGFYVIALNGFGPISNIGRIWSIMQKNILGGLEIFKGTQMQANQMPQIAKLYERNFEMKVLCCALLVLDNGLDIYLGQNDGRLGCLRVYRKWSTSETPTDKPVFKEFTVFKEQITKLTNLGEQLLIVGEQSIRLFGLKEQIILGGGCLSNR